LEKTRQTVIVVDTNIICYRWMASAHSAAADRAWNKEPDWIAPLLWRSEFRNALAGALRRKLITANAAIDLTEKAEKQFADREFLVSGRAVLDLIAKSRCSAYDLEFVVLAREQGVPLLTVDRQILRDFPELAISLERFVRQ
jgi:predicted nucleic acid-binding protein